jgi:hypothetical protein
MRLAADAAMMSWHNNCSAEWAMLAALYRQRAEGERTRRNEQSAQEKDR